MYIKQESERHRQNLENPERKGAGPQGTGNSTMPSSSSSCDPCTDSDIFACLKVHEKAKAPLFDVRSIFTCNRVASASHVTHGPVGGGGGYFFRGITNELNLVDE